MNLTNKKVLFFAPNFFGYEYEIKKELERKGAIVKLYDERPSNSTLVKAVIRLNKKSVRFYTDRYFDNVIKENSSEKFDCIFILKGETFLPSIIKKLKGVYPNACLILYLWDSIKNNNTLEIIPYFDKVYSFDNIDANNYKELKFLPLFYLDDYRLIAEKISQYTIDVLFVGTVHSDRYGFIKKLEQYFTSINLICEFYFFFQSKVLYIRKKLFDKAFKKTKLKDFHFVSLKQNDLLQKIAASKIILDIQHPAQRGLTMRSVEALGAKRKLITTNAQIKQYNFYKSSNILVIDRDFIFERNLDILKNFYSSPYEEVDVDTYNSYSISSWLDAIFSLP